MEGSTVQRQLPLHTGGGGGGGGGDLSTVNILKKLTVEFLI